METTTTKARRRRGPDTRINGVILSPARAQLLERAITRRLVSSQEELHAFLGGLEQEQRREDKKDPEVAVLRAVVWHKTAPKTRPGSPATPRQAKTDADRRRELQAAEKDQAALEASVWKPAGAGKARIRTLNLDPARAAALMNAIAG